MIGPFSGSFGGGRALGRGQRVLEEDVGAGDGAGEREEVLDRGLLLGPAPGVSAGCAVFLAVFFGTWDLEVEAEGADVDVATAGAFFWVFFVVLVVGGGAGALTGGAGLLIWDEMA